MRSKSKNLIHFDLVKNQALRLPSSKKLSPEGEFFTKQNLCNFFQLFLATNLQATNLP